MVSPHLRQRALGALAGVAIGDAMGMPTQTMSREEIARVYGPVRGFRDADPRQPVSGGLRAGTITDDTEQSLLLAHHLIARNGVMDQEAWAAELLAWERDTCAGRERSARPLHQARHRGAAARCSSGRGGAARHHQWGSHAYRARGDRNAGGPSRCTRRQRRAKLPPHARNLRSDRCGRSRRRRSERRSRRCRSRRDARSRAAGGSGRRTARRAGPLWPDQRAHRRSAEACSEAQRRRWRHCDCAADRNQRLGHAVHSHGLCNSPDDGGRSLVLRASQRGNRR